MSKISREFRIPPISKVELRKCEEYYSEPLIPYDDIIDRIYDIIE